MNIRQAAEASGLAPDTIRFYERQEVLPAPPRQGNQYRSYTAEHVATLRLAKGLRQLGVPLARVAPILAVAHDGKCGDVREHLIRTLEGVFVETERQLRDLEQTRDQLTLILDGLGQMRPDDRSVPGMQPCQCVAMVTSG